MSMKQDIVVATNNPGKILEIRHILQHMPCAVIPVSTVIPNFSVDEDGSTYAENAIKKARAAAVATNQLAIADDSGLEVDALDGAPGIYSARFGGDLPQPEKNTLLLQKLAGVKQRTARFRCVIAVVSPDGQVATSEGVCEGSISLAPRGEFGFGFDPIFIVEGYQQTMAELQPERKNTLSHRAKALRRLPELVKEQLEKSC